VCPAFWCLSYSGDDSGTVAHGSGVCTDGTYLRGNVAHWSYRASNGGHAAHPGARRTSLIVGLPDSARPVASYPEACSANPPKGPR
jgi:hypothetical protein